MKKTIILLLIAVSSAGAYPRIILEDGYNQNQDTQVTNNAQDSDFEGAWERYKMAFRPLYDALIMDDYKGAHNWASHVKDAAEDLSKNEMPNRYDKGSRKILKEIFKLTKTLAKNMKEKDKAGLRQTANHIKDKIDRLEEARNNNGKSNYDG